VAGPKNRTPFPRFRFLRGFQFSFQGHATLKVRQVYSRTITVRGFQFSLQGHPTQKSETSLFAHDNRLRFLDYSRMSQRPTIKFILEYFSGKLGRHSFEICGFKVIFAQN
jgi:hypothetical protein